MTSFVRVFVVVMFAVVAVSGQLVMLDERSLKGKIDPKRNSPITVWVRANGELTYEGKVVSLAELEAKLDAEMDYRMSSERKVFIEANDEIKFAVIRDILLIGRKLYFDDFGFVSAGSLGVGAAVPTKIILEEPGPRPPKMGALVLQVNVDTVGKIYLNKKAVSDNELTAQLKTTFETRKKRRIFRQGSREVEKSVYVRLNPSTEYQAMLRVLQSIKSSGAYPIAVEIDWLDK